MKRAIIDIGSNSVRLVIFDGPARDPIPICNEKALCGLGGAINAEGDLAEDAMEATLATLSRFRALLLAHGDPPCQAIATAALREARNGKAFLKRIRKLGVEARIISGEDEARLAAHGVIAVEPRARGVVGDMGGGSLEIASVRDGDVASAHSLSIGPLALRRAVGEDAAAAQALIDKALAEADIPKSVRGGDLYAVGGSWRALARAHMGLRDYPLSILHGYAMSAKAASDLCEFIARLSRQSLEETPNISRRRLDALPYAARALKSLIARMDAERVIVSAGGVREGLLYETLGPDERARDPLLEICAFMGERAAPAPAVSTAAFAVLEPIFAQFGIDRRLASATALLMDIAGYAHPDLRGRHAFDAVLSAPFHGVDHVGRVLIALALRCRYDGRGCGEEDEAPLRLLDEDARIAALRIGLGLRFAGAISPKAAAPLAAISLAVEDGALVARAPASMAGLFGEKPRKRLEAFAAVLELEAREELT